MKRKLTSVEEFFKDDLDTPELREAYREVLDEELGEVLKSLRQNRGLPQRVLAERMGLNRSRVAQIEAVEGLSLSLETLVRYASALGYRVTLGFADEAGEVARFPLSEAPGKESEWEVAPLSGMKLVHFGERAA